LSDRPAVHDFVAIERHAECRRILPAQEHVVANLRYPRIAMWADTADIAEPRAKGSHLVVQSHPAALHVIVSQVGASLMKRESAQGLVVQPDVSALVSQPSDDHRMSGPPTEVPGRRQTEGSLDRCHAQGRAWMLIDVMAKDEDPMPRWAACLDPVVERHDVVRRLTRRR
jgi:hypothetical protein